MPVLQDHYHPNQNANGLGATHVSATFTNVGAIMFDADVGPGPPWPFHFPSFLFPLFNDAPLWVSCKILWECGA